MMKAKPIGLYVHVPFCVKKCAYCDFCSYDTFTDADVDAYTDRLLAELDAYKARPNIKVDSIFFGGGTPSLLPISHIEKILSRSFKVFNVSSDTEITLEVNPGTLTEEKIKRYVELGINRISIGLQSIHENELKNLGRIHTFSDFVSTYSGFRMAGISNINIDIMYGIPEQTITSFLGTLEKITELSPEHLSVYSLMLEPDTPLYERSESIAIPDDNAVADMYDACVDFLKRCGYNHYEISNYAKPGFECRHNLKYWHNEEYLGIGISAYSYFNGKRYGNFGDRTSISSLRKYTSSLESQKCDVDVIDDTTKESEYIMLALRLSEGVIYSDFEKHFKKHFKIGREDVITQIVTHGLAIDGEKSFYLTDKGFFVSNSIITSLI